MINNDEVLIMQLNLLVRKKPHMRSLSVASPSLGAQLAPHAASTSLWKQQYVGNEPMGRAFGLRGHQKPYQVSKGQVTSKGLDHSLVIEERSLGFWWLQRIASASIVVPLQYHSPGD